MVDEVSPCIRWSVWLRLLPLMAVIWTSWEMSLGIRNGSTSQGRAMDGLINTLAANGIWWTTWDLKYHFLGISTVRCWIDRDVKNFQDTPIRMFGKVWIMMAIRYWLICVKTWFCVQLCTTKSFTDYGFLSSEEYEVVLNTDATRFGVLAWLMIP